MSVLKWPANVVTPVRFRSVGHHLAGNLTASRETPCRMRTKAIASLAMSCNPKVLIPSEGISSIPSHPIPLRPGYSLPACSPAYPPAEERNKKKKQRPSAGHTTTARAPPTTSSCVRRLAVDKTNPERDRHQREESAFATALCIGTSPPGSS